MTTTKNNIQQLHSYNSSNDIGNSDVVVGCRFCLTCLHGCCLCFLCCLECYTQHSWKHILSKVAIVVVCNVFNSLFVNFYDQRWALSALAILFTNRPSFCASHRTMCGSAYSPWPFSNLPTKQLNRLTDNQLHQIVLWKRNGQRERKK